MEDNLKNFKMEDDLNFKCKTTKILFLISLKLRGKPFLGLAQLSMICTSYLCTGYFWGSKVIYELNSFWSCFEIP